jgi:hypothetical protein
MIELVPGIARIGLLPSLEFFARRACASSS